MVRVATALLLLCVTAPADAQSVFSHRIPIKLPRGANGMQPDLAMNYDPASPNGILGVGWTLTGLAAITRVNYDNGVAYAGSDTYSDSNFGVLVKQADGSYRSKRESFVKFVPSGTCGDGPCSWVAFYPSGIKYNYGATADSRLLAQNSANVRTWALSSVVDLFGNSYEVTYINDAPNGQIYPNVITYTKAANISTYRTVVFSYETRTDTEPGYYQAVFQQTNRRLKWITVNSGVTTLNPSGSLIRKYRLDYEYGNTTGRSHLITTQEYGSNGNDASCSVLPPPSTCVLPAQSFGWQQGGNNYVNTWMTGNVGQGSSAIAFLTGDVNGDGKTDIIQLFNNGGSLGIVVYTSNGTGYVNTWSSGNVGQGSSALAFLAGDVNGDGKTDIIQLFNNGGSLGIIVYTSNGTGYVNTWTSGNVGAGGAGLAFLAGDVNGDGKTDVIQLFNNNGSLGMYVYTSNGTGYPAYTWMSGNVGAGGAGLSFLTGDVNGDGKTDIIQLFNNSGSLGMYTYASNGTGYPAYTWMSGNVGAGGAGLSFLTGDVNGDGTTDIFQLFNNNGSLGMYTYASNGTGYPAYTWMSGNVGAGGAGLAFLAGDVDGDGKSDIIQLFNNAGSLGMYVYTSNGTGYPAYTWMSGNVGAGGAGLAFLVGDVDGDGKSDVIQLFDNYGSLGMYVYASGGADPDLMTTLSDGLGGTVTVSYAAAPQVPGAIVPSSAAPGVSNTTPSPLVTRVITNDGRGGSYSTRFDYRDRRFYPGVMSARRDLGFASIATTNEQSGLSTVVTYNQNPGYEGRVASVAGYSSAGQILELKSYSYELVNPNPGTELARETLATTQTYELGVLGYTVTIATSYDAYGNPLTKSLAANGLPTVVTTTTFVNDPVNWIFGRVTDVAIATGSATLRHFQNTWTSNLISARSAWSDTAGGWLTTSLSYDSNGNLTSTTLPPTGDGLNRTTSVAYDATYRTYPATITDALQHTTRVAYGSDGQATSITGPNGDVTAITYDVNWRRASETRPDGGSTSYTYQALGNPVSQYVSETTSVNGVQTLTRTQWFDGTGFVYAEQATGPCSDGLVAVSHLKDSAGRIGQESMPYCHSGAPVYTAYSYDSSGRLQQVRTPDGKTTAYAYDNSLKKRSRTDANGNVTLQYFDAHERITSVVDAATQQVTYAYDPLGYLTTVTPPSGATSITYDSLGRRTSISAPQLGTTSFTYDAIGNVTLTSSNGKTVTFSFDALNRVTSKQPLSEPPVTFAYDQTQFTNGIGRLTTVTDAGGVANYSYYPSGLVSASTRQVDGSGFTTGFTYDQVGRVTRLQYPDSSYADYIWDGATLSTVMLNGALIAHWPSYDPSGRPLSVSYGNGVTTNLAYDSYGMGHLASLQTTAGTTVFQSLSFDWYTLPNTGGINLGSISDNRANRIVNGVNSDESQTFAYDTLNRLTQASGVWGAKAFAYDAIGNPTTFGGIVSRTLNFAGTQVISGTGLSNVTYDASGNMTHKSLDGIDWNYTWTVENNLATATRNGGVVATMTYDANGARVKKVYTPAGGTTVTTTYIGDLYEKRVYGNGSPQRHTINVFANGQLIASVTRTGSVVTALNEHSTWRNEIAAAFMYNPRDLRGGLLKALHVAKAVQGLPEAEQVVWLLVFGTFASWVLLGLGRSIWRSSGDRSPYGPGLRLASSVVVLVFSVTACSRGARSGPHPWQMAAVVGDTTSGPGVGTYYYHRNQIGSSTVVTDASGNEVERLSYLPFGEISQTNSSGTDVITRKFTGQEYDPEEDLAYYGARYYDPHIGRFLSADIIVPEAFDLQSINRYSYVRNNPLARVDPTGHLDEQTDGAILGGSLVAYSFGPEVGVPVSVGAAVAVIGWELYSASKSVDWNYQKREFGNWWHHETGGFNNWVSARAGAVGNEANKFGNWVGNLLGLGHHHHSEGGPPAPSSGGGGGSSTALPQAPPNGIVGQPSTPPGGGGSAPVSANISASDGWRFLTSGEGQRIVAAAQGWRGTPYPMPIPYITFQYRGGNALKAVGADCSGSVWAIYGEAGFPYGYVASREFPDSLSFAPSPGNIPQVGDVGRWDGHVMIFDPTVGPGRNGWSASRPGGRPYGPADSSWYDQHYGTPVVWYRYRIRVP